MGIMSSGGSNTRKDLFTLPEKTGALYQLKKNPDDADEVLEFKYIEKTQVTHDTFIFTFELPDKNMVLGLNLGSHVAIDAFFPTADKPEGEDVSRKYTPISGIFEKGQFRLLIKVYFKNVLPQFPNGGKLSQYLNDLSLGTMLKFRGPLGKITYLGDGDFRIRKNAKTTIERNYSKIGMLAGGTGISPLWQLLQAADENKDTSEFSLIFGNKTTKDIFMREDLEELEKKKNFKFNLRLIIDKAEEGWTGGVGFINKEMIEKHIPSPSDNTLILLCGPPIMCKNTIPLLQEVGHKPENILEF